MVPDTQLELAAGHLRSAERVVIFTGAGVSAESGIDTFRDDGGLWDEFAPEQFATWSGLINTAMRSPRKCASFMHRLLAPIAMAQPNAAHRAIARAEQSIAMTVVTQNVDGLHQEAGSTIVREIHGSLLEIVTTKRRFVRLLARSQLATITSHLQKATRSPLALVRMLHAIRPMAGLGARGFFRPSAVLFGEALKEPAWTAALDDCDRCDVMLVIGTSGLVLPAAMLPARARAAGATIIVIDPAEPTNADIWFECTACAVLPDLIDKALSGEP